MRLSAFVEPVRLAGSYSASSSLGRPSGRCAGISAHGRFAGRVGFGRLVGSVAGSSALGRLFVGTSALPRSLVGFEGRSWGRYIKFAP